MAVIRIKPGDYPTAPKCSVCGKPAQYTITAVNVTVRYECGAWQCQRPFKDASLTRNEKGN